MESIDVYHQWLGIPPQYQPPSLYRLLGISDFESDAAVIRSAAERQAMHVRRLSRGPFIDAGQELLNEIAYAKLNLIDPEKRLAYDETLREVLAESSEGLQATLPSDEVESSDLRVTLPGLIEEVDKQVAEADQEPAKGLDDRFTKPTVLEATFLDPALAGHDQRGPWLVGYHSDCDILIDHRTVSGMHCRISRTGDQWQIADLDSTNGTFVNGRKVSRSVFGATDLVVLGGDHRVAFPRQWFRGSLPGERTFFVGRAPGNEVRVSSKKVSRFHARVVISGDAVTIEDFQSVHGTYIIDSDGAATRISRCAVNLEDQIRFADATITVKQLVQLSGDLLGS